MRINHWITLMLFLICIAAQPCAAQDKLMDIGVGDFAFDHLSDINDQAAAAAQSGVNVIYGSGFGIMEYQGLGTPAEIQRIHADTQTYLTKAKSSGIRLAVGYLCATSIVKLDQFDRNWPADFRKQFASPPSEWLQQDRDGKPLISWYGGDYRPACMSNPDWRTYEKSFVRKQLDAGFDGIFFDNPTIHPQGCYCPHCMKKFGQFLTTRGIKIDPAIAADPAAMRKVAVDRPEDFLRFRSTIVADFLAEIRSYARTIKPNAIITCNNSLNAPDMFFSQCRDYGNDINTISTIEDWITIEDMATQPRTTADGKTIEFGPMYELLAAIGHGKPIIATTLADADYHTPPNLMRLAMAEAAAHGAAYLAWPTWPEVVRQKMIDAVRPQADFMRLHADLLNHTTARRDAELFLPFSRWTQTAKCQTVPIAQTLAAANVQFNVVDQDDLAKSLSQNPPAILIVESQEALGESEKSIVGKYQSAGGKIIWCDRENWLSEFQKTNSGPVISIDSTPTVRAIVRQQANRTIVHLLNLNVQKISSFEDRVTPASAVHVHVRLPIDHPSSVRAFSPDSTATQGEIPFTSRIENGQAIVELTIPRLDIWTILTIE